MYGEYQIRSRRAGPLDPSEVSRDAVNRDKKYALDTIGSDSVYMFFLSNSWPGWGFALGTMAAQIGILYIFVEGAEFDLSNDISDLVSLCLYFLFVFGERFGCRMHLHGARVSAHLSDFFKMLTRCGSLVVNVRYRCTRGNVLAMGTLVEILRM